MAHEDAGLQIGDLGVEEVARGRRLLVPLCTTNTTANSEQKHARSPSQNVVSLGDAIGRQANDASGGPGTRINTLTQHSQHTHTRTGQVSIQLLERLGAARKELLAARHQYKGTQRQGRIQPSPSIVKATGSASTRAGKRRGASASSRVLLELLVGVLDVAVDLLEGLADDALELLLAPLGRSVPDFLQLQQQRTHLAAHTQQAQHTNAQ